MDKASEGRPPAPSFFSGNNCSSDNNCSPVEVLVWACCLLDQKIRQKRKDWWSRFLISLDYVRKRTLLLWVMQYRFRGVQKRVKMLQIPWRSSKAAVIGGQIPKPSGIGSLELLAWRLWLADQNRKDIILISETIPNSDQNLVTVQFEGPCF